MTEFAAALLLAVVALGGACWCTWLSRRFRKPYYAWWAAGWVLYALRVGVILTFLRTNDERWLYWHQVLTGWTALVFLYAALSFSRGLARSRGLAAWALFPLLWSWIAIYELESFLWAVVPAIAFLSIATLLTGVGLVTHARRTGSPGAWLLGGAFCLWAVHHLDYPLLRARGAWVPWGYYLDIVFILAVVGGIALLVIDDLRRGLEALSLLAADVQAAARGDAVVTALLERPLRLRGVSGTALWRAESGTVQAAAGRAAGWRDGVLPAAVQPIVDEARRTARSASGALRGRADEPRFAAALPIYRDGAVSDVLLLVGDVRDPFSALDDEFLRTLGRQVGAALQQAELTARLEQRSGELARLSTRLVEQHEEERKRLSRELHDEAGQLFGAIRIELGAIRDVAPVAESVARLDALVQQSIAALRRVTAALRPTLLDDLGLASAVRSLVAQVAREGGLAAELVAPATLPPLDRARELALFRAAQEGITNVRRHAAASRLVLSLEPDGAVVRLAVDDDGIGPPEAALLAARERAGHVGVVGMRERIGALGGSVRVERSPLGGTRLAIEMPLASP
ncbi:MAG: sensor histidine kinase, partial [Gemmatimonadaceae bacterium]|nr:sensor histidine kinase [Gemmatimonadaceae bacterium]